MDITVPEAAERTGLSAETIRRWIRAGKLPAHKVGTQHQIEESDLDLLTAYPRRTVVYEQAPDYADLRRPSPSAIRLMDRITADPNVLGGKPVIRGTRISVELVLDFMAAGTTVEEILASYPHVSERDVRACLAFAAHRVRIEKIYPLPIP